MAVFVVYTYQFAPIFGDTRSLFPDMYPDAETVWEKKQEVFASIFEKIVFRKRNIYGHDIIFNENDILVLRLANNRHIVQESSFVTKKLEHHPSCYVIIDNRKNVQNIYIEQKQYSFEDTEIVARILSTTFNNYLKTYNLCVEIKKRFIPQEFWQAIEREEKGVDMLRFSFLYPNLPRVQEKIDEILSKASSQVHSKNTVVEFNSGDNEALNIHKDNQDLQNLVKAASESGSIIKLKFKGYRRHTTIGTSSEIVEIDNLEASLSSDLISNAAQKLITILNKFK